MLDEAFDSGICTCVQSYEKDVIPGFDISRVLTINSDIPYEIQVYGTIKTGITLAISDTRIDPNAGVKPLVAHTVLLTSFSKLFVFVCADAFAFTSFMCLMQTQFTGSTQLPIIFTHKETDTFTQDFQKFGMMQAKTLQPNLVFRMSDVNYQGDFGRYLPSIYLISGIGQYVKSQLGFYTSVFNAKPGFIYIIKDMKTGRYSKALLLYGCFKLLETQEEQ